MNRPDYLNSGKSEQTSRVNTDTFERVTRDSSSYEVSSDARNVLRNTYALLAMTLVFSAAVAGVAMMLNLPHPGIIITLVAYFGLLFAVEKTKDSAMGLVFVFALTGFMGYTLGPIVSMYAQIPNGNNIIMMALGTTGAIFLGMSAWVLTTGKDLSGMGKTLMVGILVAFVLGLGNIFFQLPALALAVSAMFVILMSGLIAYQTSAILHGGETNYISATVTLYVAIYNLFLSLLQIFGLMGSDD